jgi:hypothetical protein
MNLKVTLNPILSAAAAVVAHASGADAQALYYADYNNKICKNTPPQAWGGKYATIKDCCTSALFWVKDCVADSNGVTPTPIGTFKWYINWSQQKCVTDCPVDPTNPNCGGLAAAWVSLFASQDECCENSYTGDYRGNCLVPTSDAPSSSPSVYPPTLLYLHYTSPLHSSA